MKARSFQPWGQRRTASASVKKPSAHEATYENMPMYSAHWSAHRNPMSPKGQRAGCNARHRRKKPHPQLSTMMLKVTLNAGRHDMTDSSVLNRIEKPRPVTA